MAWREKKCAILRAVEKRNGSKLPSDIVRRSQPDANNPFLRCQLGRFVFETRHVIARTASGRTINETFPVTLFHLLGFGETWSEAEEMILGPVMPDAAATAFLN